MKRECAVDCGNIHASRLGFLPVFMVAALVLFGGAAQAQQRSVIGLKDTVTEPSYHYSDNRVTLDASFGVMDGTATEGVYDNATGRKISQLDWTFDNTAMLNAKLSVRVNSWFKVRGSGSFAITGDATMDDYDWLDAGRSDWTDWSHHDSTELKQAYMLDLGAEVRIYDAGLFKVSAVGGYKWDRYSWDASGGSFVYSTGGNFRNQTGTFNNGQLGISYTQDFGVPYLGVATELSWNRFEAAARVVGSNVVNAQGFDTHHLRNLKFVDEFDHGTFIGVDAELAYAVTNYLSIVGSYHFQEFKDVRGTTQIEDKSSGQVFTGFGEEAAGASAQSQMFSMGVRYALQ